MCLFNQKPRQTIDIRSFFATLGTTNSIYDNTEKTS